MSRFPCRVTILSCPRKVRRGQTYDIEVRAEVLEPGSTLGFVFLNVEGMGENMRFAKKSRDVYLLSCRVPDGAAPGSYGAVVFATGDNGMLTGEIRFDLEVE